MIIHASTVELAPHDLRLLASSGLPLVYLCEGRPLVPFGRADLTGLLSHAHATDEDPGRLAVIASFLRQLRA